MIYVRKSCCGIVHGGSAGKRAIVPSLFAYQSRVRDGPTSTDLIVSCLLDAWRSILLALPGGGLDCEGMAVSRRHVCWQR